MSSKRLRSALTASAVLLVSLAGASSAYAQTTTPPTNPPDQQRETRSAKTTASGDTGLFFVPTAEVLPAKRFSFSLYRTNIDDGQGFSDVSNWPLTVGVGVGGRAEIFGAFNLMTRIDRDTRPLFFTATDPDGTGGGLLPNYPLNRENWVSDIGNTLVGIKFNLTSEADQKPAAFALRGTVNLPTGSKTHGTTTGKLDFGADAILSKELGKVAELSGYAGYLMRGDPSGYELPNSIRYGAGIGFPTRKNFGLTVTAEAFGEFYSDKTITAPAGLFGSDGSPVPTSTVLKNPFVTALSATYEFPNGFFLGAGASWNMTMKSRNDTGVNCLTCKDHTLDEQGLNFRIGYHPGVRKYVAPPPPPPPPPPPAAAPPAPPAPHTLSVKASCNLCSVEVNKTDTVTATVTDSINCAVTYQWSAPSGSFTNGTARVTPWTAPGTAGSVPVTVKVTCPTDNMTASDTVNINVTQAVVKTYAFDDVYFDFDRSTLRPDALKILDGAVEAMKADSTLNLTIEGNTCNIGTAEYNLALGERRANVVRDYLTSQGVAASRLRTISYGEEKPKYDNDREETRRLNRRAVLVVRLER